MSSSNVDNSTHLEGAAGGESVRARSNTLAGSSRAFSISQTSARILLVALTGSVLEPDDGQQGRQCWSAQVLRLDLAAANEKHHKKED